MRNLKSVQARTGSGFEAVCPFPVGAIYQSTSSTSPTSIYGGGWTPLTDGRFFRPQGSWNNLGGENEHQLTVAEMPSHSHMFHGRSNSIAQSGSSCWITEYLATNNHNAFIAHTGGNAAYNNIPAHRTCYCWYRTS